MFHRNRNNAQAQHAQNEYAAQQHAQQQQRGGFMSRFHRGGRAQPQYNPHAMTQAYGPRQGNADRAFYRDTYYEGSTRSDWDHYAVRHEEALIGDPLPIMNNNLNLAANQSGAHYNGPYGQGPLANGPVNHGYDDAHYNKRHPAFNNLTKRGVPMVGPVTANGPLPGNLSSGTIVERNFVQGPGAARTRTGMIDDPAYGNRQWGSAAWGVAPAYEDDYAYGRGGHGQSLYGNGPTGGHGQSLYGNGPTGGMGPAAGPAWGNTPLYGFRDSRSLGQATPLLPDNPWTHNELGRDWEDGYRRGTIPYSSINNQFVQPSVTENFVEYGPNGERIEGYRTRTVREDIVPPVGALGQTTESTTTKTTKDVVVPGVANVGAATHVPQVPIPADAVGIPFGHQNAHPVEVIEVLPAQGTTTVIRV